MNNSRKNINAWKWILKNGKKSLVSVLVLAILTTILSIISLRFTIASKNVLDIATAQMDGNLINACLVLGLLLLIQLIIQVSISFVNVHASASLDIALKRSVFKTLISRNYLSVSKYHSGELLNRLTSDINIIIGGIISIVPNLCLLLTSIIGGFIILYRLDSFFALIILVVGPCLLLCGRLYSKRFKTLHKECQTADGKVRSFMQEALLNLIVIKSFNNQNDILDRSEKLQKSAYKLKIKRVKISTFAHICM